LLIWIYYSAQILFLGAQFSQSFQSAGLRPRGAGVKVVTEERREGNLTEKYFSNAMAALGLGFVLGAAMVQKPAGRRHSGEPGLLERATRLLAQLNR
jgi:hypothetical protein